MIFALNIHRILMMCCIEEYFSRTFAGQSSIKGTTLYLYNKNVIVQDFSLVRTFLLVLF